MRCPWLGEDGTYTHGASRILGKPCPQPASDIEIVTPCGEVHLVGKKSRGK